MFYIVCTPAYRTPSSKGRKLLHARVLRELKGAGTNFQIRFQKESAARPRVLRAPRCRSGKMRDSGRAAPQTHRAQETAIPEKPAEKQPAKS